MSKTEQVESRLKERGLLDHVLELSRESGLTLDELLDSRSPPAPEARRRLYSWLREEKGYSAKRIGVLLGKERSTVQHALGPADTRSDEEVAGG